MNAHHRLVEIVQHRDVGEGHVLDGGLQLAALVGLVANFHGLGQIRPELAAVEEDVRAVAALAVGIVLYHQAVVPGADEAVADGDIAAGLHGNAVAVGPGRDDLDAADVHIVAAVQLHTPGVGVQDTDAADGHILALPEGAMASALRKAPAGPVALGGRTDPLPTPAPPPSGSPPPITPIGEPRAVGQAVGRVKIMFQNIYEIP